MLNEILQRIQKRIKQLGLSESRAATLAGLSNSAIRDIRRGVENNSKSGVSSQTLIALAPVLKTTAGWLIDGTGEEESSFYNQKHPLSVFLEGEVAPKTWFSKEFKKDSPLVLLEAEKFFAYSISKENLWHTFNEQSFLLCEKLSASSIINLSDNDIVIVERSRFNGEMVERTVWRARQTTQGIELWALNPEQQTEPPIELFNLRQNSDETIEVVAKVLWILRKP